MLCTFLYDGGFIVLRMSLPTYGGISDIEAMAATRQRNPLRYVSIYTSLWHPGEESSQSKDELQIKVPAQKRHRAKEHQESSHNRHDHDPMPRRDLNGDHEKFVQDEDSVTDGHHPLSVDFGQDLGQTLDHAALVDGYKDPDEKGAVGEGPA